MWSVPGIDARKLADQAIQLVFAVQDEWAAELPGTRLV